MNRQEITDFLDIEMYIKDKQDESSLQRIEHHLCVEDDITKWWDFDGAADLRKRIETSDYGRAKNLPKVFCLDEPNKMTLKENNVLVLKVSLK